VSSSRNAFAIVILATWRTSGWIGVAVPEVEENVVVDPV
jgi:hypothetical membrane protein